MLHAARHAGTSPGTISRVFSALRREVSNRFIGNHLASELTGSDSAGKRLDRDESGQRVDRVIFTYLRARKRPRYIPRCSRRVPPNPPNPEAVFVFNHRSFLLHLTRLRLRLRCFLGCSGEGSIANAEATRTKVHALDDRLVLLAPDSSVVKKFRNANIDSRRHGQLVREMQALRGSVYLHDGAIRPDQLSADGLHETAEDERSWHLLTVDKDQRVTGCAWYLEHDGSVASITCEFVTHLSREAGGGRNCGEASKRSSGARASGPAVRGGRRVGRIRRVAARPKVWCLRSQVTVWAASAAVVWE